MMSSEEMNSTNSDSSEMMKTQGAPLKKTRVVVSSVCAMLLLAVAVVVVGKGKPKKSQYVKSLIDLQSTCSDDGSNCWGTKCCKNPNHKCYAKNQYWAQCMGSCDKNYQDKYDKDRNIKTGWSCLHPHQHDGTCSKDHENCQTNTECCNKDSICYIKHDGWSNCNPQCKVGRGANDYDPQDTEGWSCEIHGLTAGSGATLPEGATIEEQLNACMKHYCKNLNAASTASQNATCWSTKCAFYYDKFQHSTTTLTTKTTTAQTQTTTTNTGATTPGGPQ